MKVGAGGLQSLAQFEAVARRVEATERPGVARQELDPHALRRDVVGLIRVIERLNELAKLFNQNIRFRVRRREREEQREEKDGRHGRTVEVFDSQTGTLLHEMDPAELAALEARLARQTGVLIDSSQ